MRIFLSALIMLVLYANPESQPTNNTETDPLILIKAQKKLFTHRVYIRSDLDVLSKTLMRSLKQYLQLVGIEIQAKQENSDVMISLSVKTDNKNTKINITIDITHRFIDKVITKSFTITPGQWFFTVLEIADIVCEIIVGQGDIFSKPFWGVIQHENLEELALMYFDGSAEPTNIQYRKIMHIYPTTDGVLFTVNYNNQLHVLKYKDDEIMQILPINSYSPACYRDHIVFSCIQNDQTSALLYTNNNGQDIYTIFQEPQISATSPTFNNDGSKLAFITRNIKDNHSTLRIYAREGDVYVQQSYYEFTNKLEIITWSPLMNDTIAAVVSEHDKQYLCMIQTDGFVYLKSSPLSITVSSIQWKGFGLIVEDSKSGYWYASLLSGAQDALTLAKIR